MLNTGSKQNGAVVTRTVVRKKTKSLGNHKGSIVIKTEMVPLSKLNKYYKNPIVGAPEKTAESLKVNGQFRSIVVNKGSKTGRPNEILAGNHTYMGADKLGWKEIQVDWVDVNEDHARSIVLADNGSRDGSTYKEDVLEELLTAHKNSTGSLVGTTLSDDLLSGLLKKNTGDKNSDIDKVEDASDELTGVDDLANGIYFDSDLEYEIPALLPDMIPDAVPTPLKVWAGHELDGIDIIGKEEWEKTWWLSMWHAGSRGINWEKAIPYFYTDDFHFEPIFNDPAKNTKKILNLGIQYAVMPNYTIYPEMPVALWVYSAYRSYYVARYFQEAGVMVIPDIHTGMDDAALDITLIGIPQGCGVVAAQCQQSGGKMSFIRKKARLLKEAEDRLGFKNIIIYGHTDAQEIIERADFKANVTFVSARTARRREYLNSGATVNSQKIVKRKKTRK